MNSDVEHDITGARLLESILRSPIASVISDPRLPDNPLVAVNDAFCALTGYDREEIIGRNCRFLAGPATEPWLTDRIREGTRAHRPVLVEILNYKKDGTPFRNAVLVAPLFDTEGELEFFVGTQVELMDGDPAPDSNRRHEAVELVKQLSARQREVLQQIAAGLRSKQISYAMNLSEKTVKMHRSLIISKLGTSTVADAIRVAVQAGL